MFLYYPAQRQIMPKLRAFIDHVKNSSRTKGREAPTRKAH
jgi:hypothetical protein